MALKQKDKLIKVSCLLNRIPHEIVHKGELNKNVIASPTINRAGLELSFCSNPNHKFKQLKSTVLFGSNESDWLNSLNSLDRVKNSLTHIIKLTPPVIVVCAGFDPKLLEVLKQIAIDQKSSTTIVSCEWHSHQFYSSIAGWISEELANYVLIHGSLMQIDGIGVLIQGESGVGKSEVTLQLVRQNAIFIGDDAIEATNLGNHLFAKSSDIAGKFLEVRGIGLINMTQMFGVSKVKESTTVDVVITLVKSDNVQRQYFERVGEKQQTMDILGVKIPFYRIPVTLGRDVSSMIQAAVADLKMKEDGYNSAEQYIKVTNAVLGKK
ncbi:MAG: HPr(Ser) kinase/phosphatase [Mycoplasma sp.]